MSTTTHLYVPDHAVTFAQQGTAVEAIRAQLLVAGAEGWSEVKITGWWHGESEPVTRFELLGSTAPLAYWREILRMVMPEEESVLVTRSPIETTFG